MKMIKNALGLLVLAAALTACGGGGGHHHSTQTTATSFTSFVKGLFANTSDTAEPASINNRDIKFADKDNTHAYDSTLNSGN